MITPEDFIGVDWIARMKELRLNTLGIHSGGGASHDVLAMLGSYAAAEFHSKVRDAGLELEYEVHAADVLLERSLFETHPEYFPQDYLTGERTARGNWCVTNPEVRRRIAENAAKLSQSLVPSTHRHYFWSCDFHGGWCHCPACSPYTVSDQNLASVNAMIREIRKTDPEAELAYLGYLNHYEVPEKVQPEEGIFLEFAPMTRCPHHAIDDPVCSLNRVYWNSLKRHLELFDPARTHILEYWLDSSFYSHYRKPAVKPVLSRDVLRRDLEAYLKLGIDKFTTFAVYMDGNYFRNNGDAELRLYAEVLNEFD